MLWLPVTLLLFYRNCPLCGTIKYMSILFYFIFYFFPANTHKLDMWFTFSQDIGRKSTLMTWSETAFLLWEVTILLYSLCKSSNNPGSRVSVGRNTVNRLANGRLIDFGSRVSAKIQSFSRLLRNVTNVIKPSLLDYLWKHPKNMIAKVFGKA